VSLSRRNTVLPVWQDIVTFGASKKLREKVAEFEGVRRIYTRKYNRMEQKRTEVNEWLRQLVSLKRRCITSLKQIEKIVENIDGGHYSDHDKSNVQNDVWYAGYTNAQKTISTAETALSLSTGVSAGIGTAFGAWALASTFGVASTGTAVATLSGAAATNATLAWLGGGALAAGGGGMALGATVLGGLVVVPALIVSGIVSHIMVSKKISTIESKIRDINKDMVTIENNISTLKNIEKQARYLIKSLHKRKMKFDKTFEKIYRNLYQPVGIVPKIVRFILRVFGGAAAIEKQRQRKIVYIGDLASEFAKLINTTVL
jgi:hypothetical protein